MYIQDYFMSQKVIHMVKTWTFLINRHLQPPMYMSIHSRENLYIFLSPTFSILFTHSTVTFQNNNDDDEDKTTTKRHRKYNYDQRYFSTHSNPLIFLFSQPPPTTHHIHICCFYLDFIRDDQTPMAILLYMLFT